VMIEVRNVGDEAVGYRHATETCASRWPVLNGGCRQTSLGASPGRVVGAVDAA
jgi:hypothetical protein